MEDDDGTDLAPLKLITGDTEGADDDGVVSLSSAGVGEVIYTFDTGFLVDPTNSTPMKISTLILRLTGYFAI